MEKNALATHAPLEIERKFVIAYPDTAALASLSDVRVREMMQTYLLAPKGVTRRVRRAVEGEKTRYIYTEKTRLSDLTAIENERDITAAEYEGLLREADPSRRPIEKCRYAFPFRGIIAEVDVYSFWDRIAILEIELRSEKELPPIPPFLRVLRDVTADKRYKNASLARRTADLATLEEL